MKIAVSLTKKQLKDIDGELKIANLERTQKNRNRVIKLIKKGYKAGFHVDVTWAIAELIEGGIYNG